MNLFENLQTLGKSLMLPVAVLPAAAILLRLGAPDVFNIPFVSQAGGAVFDNLPLIFAVGIATGIAKDGNGAAALAGVIGYLILTKGLSVLDASLNLGVFAGIVSGSTAGILYNRYHEIKLPEFLGFFGGRRFVAIVTALAAIIEAGIFGVIWSPCQNFIQAVGEWIIGAGAVGAFFYGVLNRLLIPIGLHHILNSYVFFIFGEYTNSAGAVVTGEINRFFAGDPAAGGFLAGFYPVMMFGLPAVTFAMYKSAKIENRPKVAGALASMAFTAFLTGITEPIEFSFMFLAPILYGIHALLTGLTMAATYALGVLQGFGFSAGLIDYVLTFGLATNPALIIPIGLICGAIYYLIFRWAIEKFNLPTIGRYEEKISAQINVENNTLEIIAALGGSENLLEISNCVTRLRLKVRDTNLIDDTKLKSLGAKGVIRKGNAVQVVMGLQAEHVANEILKSLKANR